jgi:hypothetical protein
VHYRALEQILHIGRFARGVVGSVIVSVLAGVEKGGQGAQGGLGRGAGSPAESNGNAHRRGAGGGTQAHIPGGSLALTGPSLLLPAAAVHPAENVEDAQDRKVGNFGWRAQARKVFPQRHAVG